MNLQYSQTTVTIFDDTIIDSRLDADLKVISESLMFILNKYLF